MDVSTFLPDLAKQGTGYLLAIFIGWVAWTFYKDAKAAREQHLLDIKQLNKDHQAALQAMSEANNIALEKATDAIASIKSVSDSTLQIVQFIQNRSNIKEQ